MDYGGQNCSIDLIVRFALITSKMTKATSYDREYLTYRQPPDIGSCQLGYTRSNPKKYINLFAELEWDQKW